MATLLVVEDSPTEVTIINKCLKDSGYQVLNVNTAEAAKAILDQRQVDGIVLDVVLPGQSGFGLCRELKSPGGKAENIPIIMCSSKSEKMDKKWAQKQGANAYVTKPIDTALLINTVKQYVPN